VRKTSILTCVMIATPLALALPAYADTFTTFSQPAAPYTTTTIDYGGGDGSLNNITSIGPFTLSSPMEEAGPVPQNWETWNTPPAVESSTPYVLFSNSADSVTLTLVGGPTTVGFELEPEEFDTDPVSASFYNENGALIDTINLNVSGSGGALLFALEDTTAGASIGSVVITDSAPDTFAIAQLRANPTPEPGSLSLLGLGLLGLALVAYRKTLNA